MLFLVHTYLNRAAFNACPNKEEVYAGEIKRAREARAEGKTIGLFRRADCNGSIFIIDTPSHESLAEDLRTLPMFKYWDHVEVLPILPHPVFPDFATPRPLAEVASNQPLMPEKF
ncbi:muconolactone Delta-isomerase family protein [Glacieibacterium frigidum]|uniref:Muconolactone isomerase domain-containing protein n=1 Tax=Glacieibacterium frigidum TaxID=2593303 RepID=A0A552UES7_9SPHN|nr:muconolactone Delta-isomerase family protein [Glacieibacterium frigidum]TRW16711.1 hypothetical protein FMM06_00390 [Glacieibacterium frigidum]